MAENPYAQYSYYQQPQVPAAYTPPQYYPQAQQVVAPQQSSQGGSDGGGGAGLAGLPGGLLQTGFGIAQTIKSNKERKKREKELESEVANMPEYTQSPIIQNMLAQAQAQNNAINPAVQAWQNQAQQGAANVAAAGQRNAMSGAEAIQAAANGQAQASSMYPQIAEMQTNYNLANMRNLQGAQSAMNAERQGVFNSQMAKNDAMQNLRAGQLKNATNLWQGGWKNIIGGANAVGASTSDGAKMLLGAI